MGKDISEQEETKSQMATETLSEWLETKEAIERFRRKFLLFGPDQSADEPQSFPNWQPVKCSDEYCGWHGPAAKSVSWGEDDPKRYCPKCWNRVVKHESNGGSPP